MATAAPRRVRCAFHARRFLYKVRGPKACHFQVTPEMAAELDAMTLEQIQEQFKSG